MLVPVLAAADGPPAPLALVLPFVTLLLLIAVMPLTSEKGRHFWEHFHPLVAGLLGAFVGGYYLWCIPGGRTAVVHTLHEYFSFICLIGSLFVAAGGIHIRVKGRLTPMGNVAFLAIGAVIANVVGTTGASMILIRPWLRVNSWRVSGFHVVFFIFVVSNVGGCLTPIGDPPLFLGFLRGIPFFWLMAKAVLPWVFTVGLILAVFYVFDRRSFTRAPKGLQRQAAEADSWHFEGWRNIGLIAVIVGAVFLPAHYLIRELVMIAAAVVSYLATPHEVHKHNAFTFAPIKEVAALFIGIFLTMMPALDYLEAHGKSFGIDHPAQYYFATGGLSAVLDNAPTYVNFLQLAEVSLTDARIDPAEADAAHHGGDVPADARVRQLLVDAPKFILAISLGAVFFGAMTYIGNGPNFMVKSIAEAAHVRVPSFFGYLLRYSLPILLPIFALTGWLFMGP